MISLACNDVFSRLIDEDIILPVFAITGGVLIALVAIARRARLGGREIGLLLGLVAVWVMVIARIAIPEERTHLIEYALLAGLVQQALVERQRNDRFGGRPALAAFAVASTAGIVDE